MTIMKRRKRNLEMMRITRKRLKAVRRAMSSLCEAGDEEGMHEIVRHLWQYLDAEREADQAGAPSWLKWLLSRIRGSYPSADEVLHLAGTSSESPLLLERMTFWIDMDTTQQRANPPGCSPPALSEPREDNSREASMMTTKMMTLACETQETGPSKKRKN